MIALSVIALILGLSVLGAAFAVPALLDWERRHRERMERRDHRPLHLPPPGPSQAIAPSRESYPAGSMSGGGASISDLARHIGENLVLVNPKQVQAELASRGRISGALAVSKSVSDARKTVKMMEAAHAINAAAAGHAIELLDKGIEFARKVQEAELLPLEKEAKASELKATIAANETRAEKSRVEKKALKNPSASMTFGAPAKAEVVRTESEKMADRWRAAMKRSGSMTAREAQEILLKEFDAKHKSDPDFAERRRDFLDDLRHLRETEAARGGLQ